jgi:hypothetical protein
MTTKFFPTILMVLDICAALAYVPSGNWRMVIYWMAASALTFVLTY